ncbi:hypothetical protein AAHE18_13G235900 [Arachis hypogaea]
MGGCCCCCSPKVTELSAPTAYYYYPRASEEHVPLSSHPGAASAFSGRLLVDTNLDTSSPDTYRPPPAPIPFNVTLVAGDNHGTSTKLEELKESEGRAQTDLELESTKDSEIELPKLRKPINLAEEEDSCPICLEEYDTENPKLTTKCDHHFHLACILEWMERSETCPVCDQEMVFNPPIE